MTNYELKNKLQDLAIRTENTLEKAVVNEILSQYKDEIEDGFQNIISYHRIYGMVKSFIFHNEMETFFDTHYKSINDTILDYENRHGYPISFESVENVKSELAWIAFQDTAENIAIDLGLEI